MTALAYTVTEADGLRTYRCMRCGVELKYRLPDDGPAMARLIDHVARELAERHCLRECRGVLEAVKPPPT